MLINSLGHPWMLRVAGVLEDINRSWSVETRSSDHGHNRPPPRHTAACPSLTAALFLLQLTPIFNYVVTEMTVNGLRNKWTVIIIADTGGRAVKGVGLGLRVRIPPAVWISVSCECCVLSGRGLGVGPITRPEESYRVCVCVCVVECHQVRRQRSTVTISR